MNPYIDHPATDQKANDPEFTAATVELFAPLPTCPPRGQHMKTIFITTDELYPVLTPREHDNSAWANSYTKYEVPDETFARWTQLLKDFDAFQAELQLISPNS